MSAKGDPEKVLHRALAILLLSGVALVAVGVHGIGVTVFSLSFILAILIFAGYLFNWVVLGIHGPGWVHPVDYFKKSRELRTLLIGAACGAFVWWQFH